MNKKKQKRKEYIIINKGIYNLKMEEINIQHSIYKNSFLFILFLKNNLLQYKKSINY